MEDPTVMTAAPAAVQLQATRGQQRVRAGKKKPGVGRKDAVTLLIVLLVIFMVATLGLLGYIAWQRGMLQQPGTPSTSAAGTAGAASAPAAPVALDPLQDLAATRARAARPYTGFAIKLVASRTELAGLAAPVPGQSGSMTTEQQDFLAGLNLTGQKLIELYQKFDAAAADDGNLEAVPCQEIIAAEIGSQSQRITELVGQVYGANTDGSHDAYLLPDLFKSYYAPGRRISLTGIDEAWNSAKEARVQCKLDIENSEELRQLSARLEALKEVHGQFKTQLDSLPPYEIRGDHLNQAGIDALALLDGLMNAIEELVDEHGEYVQSIENVEQSDTMNRLKEEFLSLAKQDHFFCFGEICRISIDDKHPEQPAYDALPLHYQFVEERWSDQAIEYLRVFDESERDWRNKWGREPGTAPELPAAD